MKKNRTQTYFIGDTHFGHISMIKQFGRNQFITIQDHDIYIIRKWNSVVKPCDVVYWVGDSFWNTIGKERIRDILDRLNGNLILIIGNHCRITQNQALALGFRFAAHSARIKVGKFMINVSHYPYRLSLLKRLWLKLRGIKIRQFKEMLTDDGDYLIHAHTHNNEIINPFHNKSFCVSCEAIGYTPVSLGKITNLIREKEGVK